MKPKRSEQELLSYHKLASKHQLPFFIVMSYVEELDKLGCFVNTQGWKQEVGEKWYEYATKKAKLEMDNGKAKR